MNYKNRLSPELYEFLKKKRLVRKFLNNATNPDNGILAIDTRIVNRLSGAFPRASTSEGPSFWINASTEFDNYIDRKYPNRIYYENELL